MRHRAAPRLLRPENGTRESSCHCIPMTMRDRWLPAWMFGGGSEDAPEIHPLTPALARTLRLPWTSRFTGSTLASHLRRAPGFGWVAPASAEYLVAEPWRHRDEIASLLELHGRRARAALVQRALADLEA